MDEVVGWLVVALLKLLLWLVKLAFRLVWFAATGKWVAFGQGGQAAADQPKRLPAQRRAVRQARVGRRVDADFPFAFEPELTAPESMSELEEPEPASEDEALLLERRRELLRRARERAHAKLQRPAVHPKRSIRAAIRDRDTLRKAIVLGCALAPGPGSQRSRRPI